MGTSTGVPVELKGNDLNKIKKTDIVMMSVFLFRNVIYQDYLPMRNIFVPQVGQTPWVAGLPFFMVIALAFFISFLARHLTQ
jgi:hypothetical protein